MAACLSQTTLTCFQGCIDGASRMFPAESKKSKKARKATDATDDDDAPAPADVLVDIVIGFLEKATAYMRVVGNQVFTLLCDAVQESTIDLILAVRPAPVLFHSQELLTA